MVEKFYSNEQISKMAKELFKEERSLKRLDGWFLANEIRYGNPDNSLTSAQSLREIVRQLPISISSNAVFAGTQRDAFARSYALINPSFEVESFSGYCDPAAVYGDIEPNEVFTKERIQALREKVEKTEFVSELKKVYGAIETDTSEVAYFVEQVTGHLIPDFRPILKSGINSVMEQIDLNLASTVDQAKRSQFKAMKIALEAVIILANRYADLAEQLAMEEKELRREQLSYMARTLRRVPQAGATNLYEAIQSFMILWQVMCLEQAPNPFAFSVGNADRIFETYRAIEDLDRETTANLLKHFLVFFNVGDRSWAISQNIIIGGKSNEGEDLTNATSYALLDAYYEMNLPQPILSVKLHKKTPDKLYEELGRFFFTPGVLTPSIFNDDAMFEVLRRGGIAEEDLEDYSIAGCQEPLVMGKDNGNTTNSWLNLPKILEITLNNGHSLITGKKIGEEKNIPITTLLKQIREEFYHNVEYFVKRMVEGANGASRALSKLEVPFLSAVMGGVETGVDTRSVTAQGTKYNGSGCLIHGISVVADSFIAIDRILAQRPEDAERLLLALKDNFETDTELREFLLSCPKYGNNIPEVDEETRKVTERIADCISSQKNYLGNSFRPDFSTPSTHLLYGYWVGATPDGRKSREMLNYGIDPLYGEAGLGLGFRVLSSMKLPFEKMNGGYASHFGIDPKFFKEGSYEGKGVEFKNKIIKPLFFNELNENVAPFYLYVNVTTPETLRKVLENPKKYAPSGVYIMRIHGTFVNFLDLSSAIQNDIITRLDLESTRI